MEELRRPGGELADRCISFGLWIVPDPCTEKRLEQ